MNKYIKSYSNYVLKTKHQSVNDGTIFERDITTIGGRDQFSKGQVPIFKSGNFVITINDTVSDYKKVSSSDWHRNDEGEIWTLNTLKNYEKDEKTSDDRKIVIKKDFYDLRDYAYYGSCSELMRVSVNEILKTYPGELYVPYNTLYIANDGSGVQYSEEAAIAAYGINGYVIKKVGVKGYYTSFENRKTKIIKDDCGNDIVINSVSLIDPLTDEEQAALEMGVPYTREFKYLTNKYGNVIAEKSLSLIDNPFGINIHDPYVPEGANPLRYFANGGINNYVGYIRDSIDSEWYIDKDHEYSITIEDIIFDGLGETESRFENFDVFGNGCPNDQCNTNLRIELSAHENVERNFDCKIDCIDPGKYIGRIKLCFRKNDYSFRTIPGLQRDDEGNPMPVCCDGSLNFGSDGECIEGKYYENRSSSGKDTQVESFKIDDCSFDVTIYMFMGNNNEIKYLVEDEYKGGNINFNYFDCVSDSTTATADFSTNFYEHNFLFRIRPNTSVIEDYFNNLSDFEKVLLNRNSSPIYTATFELIGEGDYGDYSYTKQFTFPTTYGDYNLGSSTVAFSNYVDSLSSVGELYDNRFTDNLWRSMTHEAIKNFDWTYTRHYMPGEEEPFVEGGTKIQKVIRLYGREFDEVKKYIDAIDDVNTVTYDNVNNLPDYFFTDKLEENGWDVKLIQPLVLSEFVNGHTSIPIDIHLYFPKKYDENGNRICTYDAEKLNFFYDSDGPNKNKIVIQRVFNQDFGDYKVKPYACSNITTVKETTYSQTHPEVSVTKTYFGDMEDCIDTDGTLASTTKTGEDVSNGYHNDCGDIIRIYCDENEYSASDVNTEFMKRLLLNSPDIWRHKGTIEGMEMVLALFGLRSKSRIYKDDKYFKTRCSELEETSDEFDVDPPSFDTCDGVFDFNFNVVANKNKAISLTKLGSEYYTNYSSKLYNLYDYEIKEYTLFTTREEDEWLPKKNMFKYDWVNSTKLITYKNIEYINYQGLPLSFKEVKKDGVKKRYLYPHFNSNALYDGNPYYQMDGGWLQKKPFMFDSKNNIIYEDYNSENRKNKSLFTETVRNIKCVDTLQELLSNTSLANDSGDICQVSNLSGRYAVIDGYLYTLLTEYGENGGYDFIYATIENHALSIGNAFFTEYVVISNPYYPNNKQKIDLTDEHLDNTELKIYILKDENNKYDIDVFSKDLSISTFTVFENGKYMSGDNYTNYFRLNNIDYYNELSTLGWQQLKEDEYEYYRLNSIIDYRKGNNPHDGHMRYDNGHKYLTYFQKIFKTVVDGNLIDYRKYDDSDMQYVYDIDSFGFKNLIDDDDCENDYDKFLREDNKCHYFGSIISKVDDNCNDSREGLTCFEKREKSNYGQCVEKVAITVESTEPCSDKVDSYEYYVNNDGSSYKLTDIFRDSIIDDSSSKPLIKNLKYGKVYSELGEYGQYDNSKIDNVTDQIVNTKRIEIEFFIKNKREYSKEWLEEVKYIDSVILPYLTQVIPSTSILRVKYTTRDKEDWCNADASSCAKENFDVSTTEIPCIEGQTNYNFIITAEQ